MFDTLHVALRILTALGCGVVAGVFFAFSTFVMRALGRLAPAHGIAAMQSINIVVINPIFLAVILGAAIGCATLCAWSLTSWRGAASAMEICAGISYLVGTIGVTRAFNIPLNDRLAKVDPESADGAKLWADYLRSWTAWNHLRTLAALLAAALLTLAACPR